MFLLISGFIVHLYFNHCIMHAKEEGAWHGIWAISLCRKTTGVGREDADFGITSVTQHLHRSAQGRGWGDWRRSGNLSSYFST